MTDEEMNVMKARLAEGERLKAAIRNLKRCMAESKGVRGLAIVWKSEGCPDFYFIPPKAIGSPDPGPGAFRDICCGGCLEPLADAIRDAALHIVFRHCESLEVQLNKL